jgi:hypothetical protein
VNLRDLDTFYAERIRALQNDYPEAHAALLNWARWSRDCPPIGRGIAPPALWDQFKADENEEYGGNHEIPAERLAQADAKAEAPEKEPYNEKEAALLDDRIHGPGGLPVYLKELLRIAYVSRAVHESQFPHKYGCSEDAFRERLEEALRFVGRFA